MEAGTVVGGRYAIERLLGAGAAADVYLARDRILDTVVALKVLHPHLRDSAAAVAAFRREVAVGRLLDHPAVARAHEIGTDVGSGDVYLSMEYLAGGDLRRRIVASGPLAVDDVVALGVEVLDALAAAHALGIVHRDVKPQNVLRGADGRWRLADFGLARSIAIFGADGGTGVAGTPEYLAPESAESGYADARSDLYSLGVVLFEAVTGRPPFRGATRYELLRKHAAEPPPSPAALRPEVGPTLDRAILRALEKEPARRFQTAREFAAVLGGATPIALPSAGATTACPTCGEPLPDGFPYCFACRRQPLLLSPAPLPPRERWSVVVVGPGKPGDQLGHELRRRCLAALHGLETDAKRLERRLPRVPFIILGDLDEDGARELAAELCSRGLEAVARAGTATSSEHQRSERARLRRLFARKDLLVAGRALGVVAGSSGGAFSGLGRTLSRPEAVVPVLAFLAAGLLAVPVMTVVRHRAAEVRWRTTGANPALRRYLALAAGIRSPALASLTRRVVLRAGELRRLAGSRAAAAAVVGDVEELVTRAADWIEACQLVEDRLAEPAAGVRRDLERAREVLMDRILAFSSQLDRLWAALGTLEGHEARAEVEALEAAAGEAAVAVAAARETGEALR